MRDIVFDGAIEAAGGKFSAPSSAIKMPQPVEGPFIAKSNWEQVQEIVNQLEKLQSDVR